MNKIVKISKTKNGQYKVETEKEELTLSEDLLVKYRILKDKEIDDITLDLLKKDKIKEKYFNLLLKSLTYSAKSALSAKIYLLAALKKNKEHMPEEDVNFIVQRMETLGYINDRRLAQDCFTASINAGKGPNYIKNKLFLKNISRETINEVMASYTEDMEREAVANILSKEKFPLYPLNKLKKYFIDKLTRCGFNIDVAANAVNNLVTVDYSSDSIDKDYELVSDTLKNKKKGAKSLKNALIAKLISKGYDYRFILKYLDEKDKQEKI